MREWEIAQAITPPIRRNGKCLGLTPKKIENPYCPDDSRDKHY
jgi:hypothetical protein